jgi:hypothetical protein
MSAFEDNDEEYRKVAEQINQRDQEFFTRMQREREQSALVALLTEILAELKQLRAEQKEKR